MSNSHRNRDNVVRVPTGMDNRATGNPRRIGSPSPSHSEVFALPDLEGASEKTLRDYLIIFYRRKILVICACVAGLALAFAYQSTQAPVYRSVATLKLDAGGGHSISGLRESASVQYWARRGMFQTEIEILKAGVIAESVVERLDASERARLNVALKKTLTAGLSSFVTKLFGGRPAPAPLPANEETRNKYLAQTIRGRLTVDREGTSNLIRVALNGPEAALTKKILDAYIETYIQEDLQKRRRQSLEAAKWLREEQARVEKKLVRSLADLVQFSNRHGMVSLDSSSNHVITSFNKAAEGLVESKEQRAQLEAFLAANISGTITVLPGDMKPPDLQTLQSKVMELESTYAQMRDIYAEDYPKIVLVRKQIESLRRRITDLEGKTLNAAVMSAKEKERLRQKAFDNAKVAAMNVNSLGVQYAVLKKDVESNEHIYKILLQKSKEMELNSQTIESNVSVVAPAGLPIHPTKTRKRLSLAIGLFTGLLVGLGFALFLEKLDDKVRTTQDIEERISLPSLGVIPDVATVNKSLGFHGNGRGYEFLTHDAPRSPVADAIRNVKTSIFLSQPAGSLKCLVVSSSVPREGKTFVSTSIAAAICSAKKRVLVVDCDLRKPRVAEVFGHGNGDAGLTTLLTERSVTGRKMILRSRVPGLFYLPAGRVPPNPVGLLESDRMAEILDWLYKIFDIVIIDSPPVLGFSDAQILAAHSDGVILVCKEGHIPYEVLRQAHQRITVSGARVFGVVLNMAQNGGFGSHSGYRYYKYYRYSDYYSDADGTKQKRKKRTSV